jgi:sugar lactone lactonase YvrE
VHDIKDVLRLPSPAPRPQSIAFDGEHLWMGSVETNRLYSLDPHQWTVIEETPAPGKPWGMAVVGDELRVLLGETEEDHRRIRRFVPGHGFKTHESIDCPDDTGSHLSYDGIRLYVSQWYNKRIVGIDETGTVVKTIELPRGVAGQTFADGAFFAITVDDEESTDYYLTRVAVNGSAVAEDLARVGLQARGLAYDGARFWTNHREHNEIVGFSI